MSRRAQRRRANRLGRADDNGHGGLGKRIMRIVAVLGLVVMIAGFGSYAWLKSYLHSDDFRDFMGGTVGGVLGADASFELFEWQGMHARTEQFSAENGKVIQQMRAEGLQGSVSLSAVRRGVWEIQDLRIDRLEVTMAGNSDPSAQLAGHGAAAAASANSGFLAGLLPDRAEFSEADVSSLHWILQMAEGDLRATDVAMNVDQRDRSGSYDVILSGGKVGAPWLGAPLKLRSASGKYKDGHIYLTDSRLDIYDHGLLTLKGEIADGRYAFFATVADVRAGEMVREDWQKRITGDLNSRFKVKSTANGNEIRGELELKDGILTALPLLDRIAAYVDTSRFRRLNLSEARLEFYQQGKRLDLTEIVIASEGLVRVTGNLSVVDRRLEGSFRVGIMPGLLAHIPGAETKVFLRGEKGLLWAPLRITGTVDQPQEDLSKRLVAAAGERMFELAPETGKMVLKFAHETATELPAKALEAGVDLVDEGVKVIKEVDLLEGADLLDDGVDTLREGAGIIQEGVGGVLDLLPLPSEKDE